MTIPGFEAVLGALLVFAHGLQRFNTPPTNRPSTTALRYYVAAFGYCGVGIALYCLLLRYPQVIASLARNASLAQDMQAISPSLVVAFLLTIFLPNIPILSDLDQRMQRWFQTMAAIPSEARRLATELSRAQYEIPESIRVDLIQNGVHPEDIMISDNGSPRYLWTKLSALMAELEVLEEDRRFSVFVASVSPEYDALRTTCRELARKAETCFRLTDELRAVGDSAAQQAIRHYQAEFIEQCEASLRTVYAFLSRGLLKCDLTYFSRMQRLQSLGFTVKLIRPRLNLHQLMTLFGFVGIVLVATFVLPNSYPTAFGERLGLVVMIAVIYVTAVMCAIYPKDKWSIATMDPQGGRPVAYYFAAGLLALVASLILNFLMQSMLHASLRTGFAMVSASYPWMLMSFTTAFLVAYFTDDKPSATLPRGRLRIVEGISEAVVASIVAWMVHGWLTDVSRRLGGNMLVPDIEMVLLRAASIGFLIGFLVPTWYREAPRERESARIVAVEQPQPIPPGGVMAPIPMAS